MKTNITKRQFLKTGISAAALAGGITSLPGSRAFAQDGPKSGGHLRVAMAWGATSNTLDPATSQDPGTYHINFAVRNNLMEIAPDGSVVPELAQAIEPSSDVKQWVVTLRQGVEFHDGKPLTPEDVIASINHHRGEESKSAVKGLADSIADIRKDGNDKIVFELVDGNADFPAILADPHFGIMPEVDGKPDWQSGNGTGGYTLANYEPGVRSEFSKHGNYWKEGRAHLDSVEVVPMHDPVARTNAMLTNAVDVIEDVVANQVDLLTQRGVSVRELASALNYYFGMNIKSGAPFDDVDVRLALKYAIDREAILKSVLNGRGQLGNDTPINDAYFYFAGDIEQRVYDPEKARFHLNKAGYDSLSVPLSTSDGAFSGAVDAALLYKEHAKAAGIEIEVIREPADGYWSNVWGQKPMSASLWGGRPTTDLMLSLAYLSTAAWNDTGWANPRFDELVMMARTELDKAKRRELYREAQMLIRDDGGSINFAFANWIFGHNDKVGLPNQVGSTFNLDGARFVERWWAA